MFEQLNESVVNQWLNSLLWGFPGAEVFHLICLGTFFGGMMLLDLRLLGFNRFISSISLMKHVLGCIWIAFAGVIISGSLLFMYMPYEYSTNPVFKLKMCLIIAGGLNALWMHKKLLSTIGQWDMEAAPPMLVRLSALVSVGIWVTVLACGRLIAYFYGAGYFY